MDLEWICGGDDDEGEDDDDDEDDEDDGGWIYYYLNWFQYCYNLHRIIQLALNYFHYA